MDFDTQHPLLLACRELAAAFDAHDALVAEHLGTSRTELRLLNRLEGGSSSQVDLAHHLHVTRAAVTTIVDRLAAAGLVVRAPSPVDRRVKLVTLTPKVWQVLGQHYRPAGQRVLALTDTMSATDTDRLTGHLKAITAALGAGS
ncbi:MarR family winged helix-turn-helix transcriptional regulator [Arthrobacter sp. L77]|uniref:MarR family winged helix-turn-helix transcriptional regulator n=1 Tax=Arthrobacter sp. L77 TaxID=1496689 RepID=UPI0018CF1051|nr:MarR family transcriptional regulator [Arthrobacter sp. L77]